MKNQDVVYRLTLPTFLFGIKKRKVPYKVWENKMILHGMLLVALPYSLKWWWVYYNISSNCVIRKNSNLETIQPYQHGMTGP